MAKQQKDMKLERELQDQSGGTSYWRPIINLLAPSLPAPMEHTCTKVPQWEGV